MKLRSLFPLVALLAVTSPLFAGPPWLSIELPPNPFDAASRGAFLLVHAFHHAGDGHDPVSGRAVGVVEGQRREVKLTFQRTSRPGVYSLRNQWGDRGEWTLVISNQQADHGDGNTAEVMVKVSGTRVIGVEAATGKSTHAELPLVPRRFTDGEVEASLRGRAATD